MRMLWAVAAGAAVGGLARYWLVLAIQQRTGGVFPWGTLVVNVTGSLLLGFILHYAVATPGMNPELRLLLTTGFCGGYTTFSAYSYETFALLEDGQYQRAGLYAVGSVVVALAATVGGFLLARQVVAIRDGL